MPPDSETPGRLFLYRMKSILNITFGKLQIMRPPRRISDEIISKTLRWSKRSVS